MKPTVRIMLYLPPDLAENLTSEARAQGRSRNAVILDTLATVWQRDIGLESIELRAVIRRCHPSVKR